MSLTIFTPTYNRAYCVGRLYQSLVNQTDKNFIWLVIDDGSTDNTEELISTFIRDGKIEVRYVKQKNGGKHVAFNHALDLCTTDLFTCVDSDDYLTNVAVETILSTYKSIAAEKYLGMYFRQIHQNGADVAQPYPKGVRKVGITELYHRFRFRGDTMIILRKDLIGNVRFPTFPGERFVTERVFYNELDRIAPMYLCEDRIYVSEYLPDGYTANANRLAVSNPYGSAYAFLSEAHYSLKNLDKVKNYAQYLAFMEIFNLQMPKKENCFTLSRTTCFGGKLLKGHYVRLYRGHVRQIVNHS